MSENSSLVLVVDDEPVTCVMLKGILEKAGYRVITANNGADGVRYAIKYEPDLILLDIILPDIDGYEVRRRIREINTRLLIPIIFITALDEKTVIDDSKMIGREIDYIQKPIRSEILLARVANLLDIVLSRKQLARRNEQLKKEIVERDRLAAVARQSSDSVFIIDLEGTILYANPACEKNSGHPVMELEGRKFHEARYVAAKDENFREMMEHVFSGKEWRGNIHSLRSNGSSYLEEVAILPFTGEGGFVEGHVVMKKDVTERRRLESIASSVNLMDNVGFIFSGIRHELGNPVNSLKMTLSVLRKRIDDFSMETIVDFLERSHHEIGRIEYLLRSLRSFSMFERPVPEIISMPDFLETLLGMHRKLLDTAGVEVEVRVEEGAEEVFADPRALLQVMLNMLTNALAALEGREEPLIVIRVNRKSDSLICLSLQDNGCGISEKDQEMLFKPFFTTRPGGTGMGLVIVKKMLVEMNCSIHLESREQEGTTFFILLPCGENHGDAEVSAAL